MDTGNKAPERLSLRNIERDGHRVWTQSAGHDIDDVGYTRDDLVSSAAAPPDGSMTPEQLRHAELIAESRGVDLETAQELVYLRSHAIKEPLRLAVGSLLDVVSELTIALEQGNRPDEAFTSTVVEQIAQHKKELGFYE